MLSARHQAVGQQQQQTARVQVKRPHRSLAHGGLPFSRSPPLLAHAPHKQSLPRTLSRASPPDSSTTPTSSSGRSPSSGRPTRSSESSAARGGGVSGARAYFFWSPRPHATKPTSAAQQPASRYSANQHKPHKNPTNPKQRGRLFQRAPHVPQGLPQLAADLPLPLRDVAPQRCVRASGGGRVVFFARVRFSLASSCVWRRFRRQHQRAPELQQTHDKHTTTTPHARSLFNNHTHTHQQRVPI